LHALHYANGLLVRITLAFQKLYLLPEFDQFQVLLLWRNKLRSVFYTSVLLFRIGFVIALSKFAAEPLATLWQCNDAICHQYEDRHKKLTSICKFLHKNSTDHWFGINWHVLSQSECRNCCLYNVKITRFSDCLNFMLQDVSEVLLWLVLAWSMI